MKGVSAIEKMPHRNWTYVARDEQKTAALRQPCGPPYLYYLHAASLLRLNSKEYAVMLHDLAECC